jgi:hypothetical protein
VLSRSALFTSCQDTPLYVLCPGRDKLETPRWIIGLAVWDRVVANTNFGAMRLARTSSPVMSMVDQIGRAIAKADGARFEDDPARFRRLAVAALRPLTRPTDTMVDAAHAAVSFDGAWPINGRADFRKAVRAMIRAGIAE